MLKFVGNRLLSAIPGLIGLMLLAFVLIKMSPTDPAVVLAGDNASVEQIKAIRKDMGLDRPIPVQFTAFFARVLQGDLGVSLYSKRPIADDAMLRLPATIELTIVALTMAAVGGVTLGVFSAAQPNTVADLVLRLSTITGLALAPFWLAIMLQLVFSLDLGWLPLRGRLSPDISPPPTVSGMYLLDSLITGNFRTFQDAFLHIVLPATTLAIGGLATVARFTRAAMMEVLKEEFVTYSVAAGIPLRRVITPFALRNALIAPVTQLGLLFGGFISGAVAIEAVFDWPGVGSYLVQSILTGDTNVTLALTLIVGTIYSFANICADVVQCFIDPRLLLRK